jgi:hypothetical protein
LTENNPNLRMVLERNTKILEGKYIHLLDDKFRKKVFSYITKERILPFIDKAIYSLEKEQIPRWNKFLTRIL